MKFDVIIGNPPYQLDDGGNGASASPLYHLFIQQAKKLNPQYLSMIIPARWYAGGKGLDSFRDEMLHDRHIVELHDYVDAGEVFTGVEIKGGVCFFLRNQNVTSDCKIVSHNKGSVSSEMRRELLEDNSDTFIRYNDAINILRKIQEKKETSFETIVSPRKPFGLPSNFREYSKEKTEEKTIHIFAQKDQGYISKNQILRNHDWLNKWKVYIPEAIGSGNMESDIVKPILGAPNTICSETYVVIGPFNDDIKAENAISFVKTKFFHFMLGLKKITQHTTSKTYSFIPLQDFSKPWTDAELYEKYGLTQEEIDFIESMIRPME